MTRLIQLSVKNWKNITAIELPINRGATIIAGENGAGKTAMLDAVEALIRGPAAFPEQPIRRGASRCELIGEFDNGYRVERVIGQGKVQLKVTGPDGQAPKGGAQSFLNKLFNAKAFDPNQFAEMEAKAQAETIRRITGLDTGAIDAEIAAAFEERTKINREVDAQTARLAAMPAHEDAPEKEVVVTELLEELKRLARTRETNDAARSELAQQTEFLEGLRNKAMAASEKVEAIEQQIKDLQVKLDLAKVVETLALEHQGEQTARLADWKAEVDKLVDPDTTEVEGKIAGAAEANRKLTENAARVELASTLGQSQMDAKALTDLIEEKRGERTAQIAAANMPVAGLEIVDNQVVVSGVPVKQLSHSEQMKLGVAIEASSSNPELRLLVVREAYACGRKRLDEIIAIAIEHDFDVLLEVLDESIPGAIIIEDGSIAQ